MKSISQKLSSGITKTEIFKEMPSNFEKVVVRHLGKELEIKINNAS